jgi:hypothetical protein
VINGIGVIGVEFQRPLVAGDRVGGIARIFEIVVDLHLFFFHRTGQQRHGRPWYRWRAFGRWRE